MKINGCINVEMQPVTKRLTSGLSTIGVPVRAKQKISTLREAPQSEQTAQHSDRKKQQQKTTKKTPGDVFTGRFPN